jgi:DNA polymerase-3 subunit alpha
MLFATLDDLEGQVEMLVFNSAYAANAEKVDVDRVVIVRGRVDHKEQGEVKLVAQEVEPFEPTPEEVALAAAEEAAEPRMRRVTVAVRQDVPESFLDELKDLCRSFPGDHELMLVVGARTLVLGDGFRVAASGPCFAELDQLAGVVRSA